MYSLKFIKKEIKLNKTYSLGSTFRRCPHLRIKITTSSKSQA